MDEREKALVQKLYEDAYDFVFDTVKKTVGEQKDRQETEEIVQRIFMRMCRSLDSWKDLSKENQKVYLGKIVQAESMDGIH